MKRSSGVLVAAGLVFSLSGGGSWAESPQVDQIVFEATVSKAEKVVSRSAALVKVGSVGELQLGKLGKDKTGKDKKGKDAPRLGFTYKVDASLGSAFTARVTTLVDGKEVATQAVSFDRDQTAGVMLDGGGYVWDVSAQLMTPELMQRRKAERR